MKKVRIRAAAVLLMIMGAMLTSPSGASATMAQAVAVAAPSVATNDIAPQWDPDAGTTCHNTSPTCTGKGPVGTGCSTAAVSTVRQRRIFGVASEALVELRYSAVCQAYWARSDPADSGMGAWTGWTIKVERSDGTRYFAGIDNPGPVDWTLMVADMSGTSTRACIKYGPNGPVVSDWYCSRWD